MRLEMGAGQRTEEGLPVVRLPWEMLVRGPPGPGLHTAKEVCQSLVVAHQSHISAIMPSGNRIRGASNWWRVIWNWSTEGSVTTLTAVGLGVQGGGGGGGERSSNIFSVHSARRVFSIIFRGSIIGAWLEGMCHDRRHNLINIHFAGSGCHYWREYKVMAIVE